MARQRRKAKATTTKAPCPECGGRKFGRGYNHKPGCSRSFNAKGPRVKRRRSKGAKSRRVTKSRDSGSGVEWLDRFGTMAIESLIAMRHAADNAIRSRRKEVMGMLDRLRKIGK